MTTTTFLTETNYALRGVDAAAPDFGSEEANYWLSILNRKKNEIYQDVAKKWRLTYEVRNIGTITASTTPEFDLDDDFLALSGDDSRRNGESTALYIITTDGKRVDIQVTTPERRNPYKREAFIAGFDPEKVYITNEIKSTENIVGGTLYAPAFWMPADVVNEDDILPFLDPNWAVVAVAATVAFGDIVYEDKASDLQAQANDLYTKMVKRNKGLTFNNAHRVPVNVKRIATTEVR